MGAPKRIRLSRAKGYRKPEGAVVVSRPSKWGNPFVYRTHTGLARVPAVDNPGAAWEYEGRISADGMRHDYHHPDGSITECHVRYMTRAEIVQLYRAVLLSSPQSRYLGYWVGKGADRRREYVTVEDVRRELAGKDLGCWCPLDKPCHADALLEIANAVPSASPAKETSR